jgi:hypothetical protein
MGEHMKPVIRNILVVVAGLVIGSIVNMSLIMMGGEVIPAPTGADVTTMEGLKSSIHLFEAKHFLFPFLAHALGTLVGALVVAWLAASHQFKLALVIGFLFLAGGISNVIMLPSPLWFNIVDLVGAYIPMAWIRWKLANSKA